METALSFGYWIRRQRKALDLTQQVLAERVGYSLAEIKKIESDERRPSRQIAMREKLGDHRPPVEQNSVERDLAVIGSKVDGNEFAIFSAEGRTMTVEQAIDFALQG